MYLHHLLLRKVEILKGEAERQRLQREELEMELQAIRQQMHSVKSCDSDMKRFVEAQKANKSINYFQS